MLQGLIKSCPRNHRIARKYAVQRRSERQPKGWRFALWLIHGPTVAHLWPTQCWLLLRTTVGFISIRGPSGCDDQTARILVRNVRPTGRNAALAAIRANGLKGWSGLLAPTEN